MLKELIAMTVEEIMVLEIKIDVSREELAGILNLSRPTITKTCQQLTEAGLIREVRQGQNKPNIIHICKNS
jgi:predicted transcriptional regulator